MTRDDETTLRVSRQSRTETPITEPAKRGFFHACSSLPWVALQWAALLMIVWAALVLSACSGPDETHAASDVQADLQAIAQALEGERTSYISPEDWIAAKHALLTARGGR